MADDLNRDFLSKHSIDVNELARIKHRLFVVGRFNSRKVSLPEEPPQVYLFTNRSKNELSHRYVGLFTKAFGINYESFINALQPAVAEEVKPGRIPQVVQQMPSTTGSEAGSVVIDMWNFFFLRAISNSDQEAFKGEMSGAAREILREGEGDPGRGIYKLIRKNLNQLCTFQPRTPELIEAFSELLGSTGRLNLLPAYAYGDALPAGFLEHLIDFVFSPNLTADFSLDGIDLTDDVWDDLRKSDRARASIVKVVNTFRNAAVGAADQHAEMKVRGGASMYQEAQELLSKRRGLLEGFRESREAYNALNQIVRSKVLLSMILDWVFKAHYDLDVVKKIENDDAGRDQMVSQLILGEVRDPGVAEPIKRATTEERERFKRSLIESFEKLIMAVIAEDGQAATAIASLAPEVRPVAEVLRGDPQRRELLKRMAMMSGDPRPFIESQKIILVDVLIPVLYQAPTVSLFDLRVLFRTEVQTAYLTAVTLDDKYQGIVRQLAQEFLPTFTSNIDPRTRAINNAEKMQSDLLRVYVDRIANKDLGDRIIEAQEQIKTAMTVLENTVVAAGQTRGASHVMVTFSDSIAAARRTPPGKSLSEAVGEVATRLADESLRAAENKEKVKESVAANDAASASLKAGGRAASNRKGEAKEAGARAGSIAGESSRSAAAGDAQGHAAQPSPAAEAASEMAPPDALTGSVGAMVRDFIASNPAHQRKELIDAIRERAGSDEKLVEQAGDSVRVFHEILTVIYERYRENQEKKAYIGKVERMTLANLMLANQEALGLGKACSNLYAMLLDVVENMDPENPDPRSFIRDFSLTKYFDNEVLEKKDRRKYGVTELRETLSAQVDESLGNTVRFISELRGVKYLMDIAARDTRAEIVVVNATANEFRDWILQDNLTGDHSAGQRLHSGFISDAQRATACPGLVYLTDSAFSGDDVAEKIAWLESLKRVSFTEGQQRLILPPLCVSTGVPSASWIAEGEQLAKAVEVGDEAVPAPVLIVGPSPYMNRPNDKNFGTYLPAGYVFAAHFLCEPEQRVNSRMLKATDSGRFRVIGGGTGAIRDSLNRAMWGGEADDTYAFAVDFYLYILLSVLATAQNTIRSHVSQPDAESFFKFFTGYKDGAPGVDANRWMTSRNLDPALLGGNATKFSLNQEVWKVPLEAVSLILGPDKVLQIRTIKWFNQALQKAGLPHYPTNQGAKA